MKKILYVSLLGCILTGFVAQAAPGSFTALLASAKTLTTQYGAGITAQAHPKAIKIICADGEIVVPKEIAAQLDYFKAQDNFQRRSGSSQNAVDLKMIFDISTAECQALFDYIQTRNVACIPDQNLVMVFYAADYLDAPQKLIQALAQRCLDRCDINSQDHALLYDKIISYIKSVASAFPRVVSKGAELIDRGILTLSNQGITNLNGLVKYATPYVTTLNLNDNALITLDIEHILQCFPNLKKINARNNMLSNTTDIKAIKNKEGLSIQLHGNPIPSDDIENTKKLLRPTRLQKNRHKATTTINKWFPEINLIATIGCSFYFFLKEDLLKMIVFGHCSQLPLILFSTKNKIVPELKKFMPTKIMHDKKVSMNDLD